MSESTGQGVKETNPVNPLTKYNNYNNYKLRELTARGYVNRMKIEYKLNIPMDIVTIITKFYSIFKWSKELSHSKFMIENDIIENKNEYSEWIHAYDSDQFDKGTIKWTVKILSEKVKRGYNHWTIGVVDATVNATEYFPLDAHDGIGYNSSGDFYNDSLSYGGYEPYGPKYGVGDILTTIADFNTLSVSFILNGKDLGKVRVKLAANKKYRFVVTSFCVGDTLTYLRSRGE